MILAVLLWKLGTGNNSPIYDPERSDTTQNITNGAIRKPSDFGSDVSNSRNPSQSTALDSFRSLENEQNDVRKFENEIAQTRVKNALESASKFVAKYDDASSQFDELRRQLVELLTSESGAKIASSIDSTKRFMAFQSIVASMEEQFEKLGDEKSLLEKHIQFIENKSPSQAIVTELVSKLEKLKPSLFELSKTLDSRKKGMATIVREASKSEASRTTLQERLNELAVDDENQVIRSVKESQEVLLAEKKQQRIDAQNQRLASEIEAEKSKAAAEQAKREEVARANALQAEADRKKIGLKAELQRDWPKVELYLGILFVKSTSQPSSRGLVETREAMPVSLMGLKEYGYGNPDIKQACSSLLLFISYYKSGGRGNGPYGFYTGAALNSDELAAIRPAYDFLEKYGLLLVEEGKLSK